MPMIEETPSPLADDYASHPGFLIDVPVTLTVAVRGPGMTEARAQTIARRFANDKIERNAEDFMIGYADDKGRAIITEATLEATDEETSEVIDELEVEGA